MWFVILMWLTLLTIAVIVLYEDDQPKKGKKK